MANITDRRGSTIRARLARLAFSMGKLLLGTSVPRQYAYYAARVPEMDVLEIALSKVSASKVIEPDEVRDALYRIAQEMGTLRREQVIARLALDDAGILIMPADERARLHKVYNIHKD